MRRENTYTGPIRVRAAERGLALAALDKQPHIEDWVEQLLIDAGVLEADEWHSGRTTDPVTITVTVEYPAAR